MQEKKWPYKVVPVAGISILLASAALFDRWQDMLKKRFGETFDFKFTTLRFWILPAAMLLFTVLTLSLYRFSTQHSSKFTNILFLIVGSIFLFYPTFFVNFQLSSHKVPRPTYFADSMVFYISAWLAATGLHGMLNSKSE